MSWSVLIKQQGTDSPQKCIECDKHPCVAHLLSTLISGAASSVQHNYKVVDFEGIGKAAHGSITLDCGTSFAPKVSDDPAEGVPA